MRIEGIVVRCPRCERTKWLLLSSGMSLTCCGLEATIQASSEVTDADPQTGRPRSLVGFSLVWGLQEPPPRPDVDAVLRGILRPGGGS